MRIARVVMLLASTFDSIRPKSTLLSHHLLLAICALVFVMSAFSPKFAHASGVQGSIPPKYYCVGGLCVAPTECPNGSISAFRPCSEGNYNCCLQQYYGKLTFLYLTFDRYGNPTLWWSSQGNGNYITDLGLISAGQVVLAVDRNLGFKGCGSCGGTMVGNPVNLSFGNKFADESDYDGEGSFPLLFHRYYNSAGSGDGATGNRWGHTYSRTLLLQSLTEVKLFRDDGEIRYFEQ